MGRSEIRGGRQIFRKEIPVWAKVYTLGGFSAHADGEQLLTWHGKTGGPHTTYLVHGEEDVMQRFATRLKGTKVVMPDMVLRISSFRYVFSRNPEDETQYH